MGNKNKSIFFRVQTDREIFGCLNVWLVKVVEVQVSNEK